MQEKLFKMSGTSCNSCRLARFSKSSMRVMKYEKEKSDKRRRKKVGEEDDDRRNRSQDVEKRTRWCLERETETQRIEVPTTVQEG